MNPVTHIANFAIQNGITIFVVSLLIFIGKNLDIFVKKKSRIRFAQSFLKAQAMDYRQAAEISLEALDTVFKSRDFLSLKIPHLKRLYAVSIVIASTLLLYYLLISSGSFSLAYAMMDETGPKHPILLFVLDNGFQTVFLLLLPLLIFIVNPILDFFSYTETRFLLQSMIKELDRGKRPPFLTIIVHCFYDLVYSFGLFVFFIYGARNLFDGLILNLQYGFSKPPELLDAITNSIKEPFKLVDSYFSGFGVDGLYGGILLSTFISTLFVWYVFSALFLSLLQKYISIFLSFINRHTHIVRMFIRTPFSIIAYLTSALVILVDIATSQL